MKEPAVREPAAARVELEERFQAFVESHRERARRLAWRLVGGDDVAAEDVAQEAFIKAYRGLDRFRDDASLGTWFYRILVRQAQNYQRWRAVRETWHRALQKERQAAEMPEDSDPLLRRRLAAALQHLSRGQKDAFVLVHLEGLSVRETAELLRKSEGTIKSHLHRALQTLRHELADLTERAGGEVRDDETA